MATDVLHSMFRQLRQIAYTEQARGLTDAELLQRFVAERDDVALTLLVRRHGPMIWAVCRRVLRDRHAAEDAFQATIVVLARRAGVIRKRHALASWLHGVAFRVAVRAKAQAATRRNHETRAVAMRRGEALDETTWEELRGILDEEIAALSERLRAPLVLCCLEGKTQAQAAVELRCPKSTLQARLMQARELLRQGLVRRGVAFSTATLATLLAEEPMRAALPPLLTLAAVRAATTGALSPSAARLVEGVLHALAASKIIKGTAMLVLLLGALAGGAGLVVREANNASAAIAERATGQEPRLQIQQKDDAKVNATAIIVPAIIIEDGEKKAMLIAVNPETGEWRTISKGEARYPRVGPDQETIVFLRGESVWNCDAKGFDNPGKLFAWEGYGQAGPIWSADGKNLYYSTLQATLANTVWRHESWRCDPDGNNPIKLKIPASEALLDVSRAGKLCLTRSRLIPSLRTSDLNVMKLDGTETRRLSLPGWFNEDARFAPDGKSVAYCRQDEIGYSVWVVNTDGAGRKKAFDEGGVYVGACCWHPDGRRLAVVVADLQPQPDGRQRIPIGLEEGHWRIELMDADGQNRRKLPLKATVSNLGAPDWYTLPADPPR
jgi:RNA polymerase sigma factor (sigma-70 family)